MFAAALTSANTENRVTNEKGAIAFDTTLNPCLDLFFQFVRGSDDAQLFRRIDTSWKANALTTLKIVFQGRDVRGGKGERKLFRTCLVKIAQEHPKTIQTNLWAITEMGRWDDLFCLWAVKTVWPDVLKFIANSAADNFPVAVSALSKIANEDGNRHQADAKRVLEKLQTAGVNLELPKSQGKTSLLGKWLPSEGSKWDKKELKGKLVKSIAIAICKAIHPECDTKKCWPLYRLICTTLRMPLELVETSLASKNIENVNYNAVPGQAMRRYGRTCGNPDCKRLEADPPCKKCKAFIRQDTERYQKFLDELKLLRTKPEEAAKKEITAKVNAKTLLPHEVVKSYMAIQHSDDEILDSMWEAILDRITGDLSKFFCLVDVSGSMHGLPMEVAIAMGLLVATKSRGPFQDAMLTFEETPHFVTLKEKTLRKRVVEVAKLPWGGSTQIHRAFTLILEQAIKYKLKQEDLPEFFLILSDMQFDYADRSWRSNLEVARQDFEKAGYKLPKLILWNLRATNTFPTAEDVADNATLMSGFSPDMLNCMLDGETFNPASAMLKVLNQERYSKLEVVD